MRIVVEAFKESLELGLSKHGQVVVRSMLLLWPPDIQPLLLSSL